MEARDATAGEVVVSGDSQCGDVLLFSQSNDHLHKPVPEDKLLSKPQACLE